MTVDNTGYVKHLSLLCRLQADRQHAPCSSTCDCCPEDAKCCECTCHAEHRMLQAEPTPPANKMPLGGMDWACSCGVIGWCAADIAEQTWYRHTHGDEGPLDSFAWRTVPRERR